MKLSRIKRILFKAKRSLKRKQNIWSYDASREVREVARLGQRLVIMELR